MVKRYNEKRRNNEKFIYEEDEDFDYGEYRFRQKQKDKQKRAGHRKDRRDADI